MSESMSYKEAALAIGCDHHYVRMLVAKERIRIHHREEVRPNVLKVFVCSDDVAAYIEANKVRRTVRVRVTEEELQLLHEHRLNVKE